MTLTAILLLSLRVHWLNPVLPTPGWDRWAYYFYLQNVPQIWHSQILRANILAHFWSLAVEEQFYLVWPMIVWLLPERFLFRACLLGICSAFALRLWLMHLYGPQLSWVMWTPGRGGEALLMGAILATVLARQERIRAGILFAMAGAGFTILLFIAVRHRGEFLNTDAGPYMYTIGYTGINLISAALIGASRYFVPV